MAKRGPKQQSPEMRALSGESRPSRKVVTLFADHASRPDPEKFSPPKWLAAAGKKIWDDKVSKYRQRGQKVGGFEDSLAQYCALEAELAATYKRRLVPPMAMVTAHRIWAAEFYDTPASQNAHGKGKPAEGKFGGVGKREARDA